MKFGKIFNNTYIVEYLQTTASEVLLVQDLFPKNRMQECIRIQKKVSFKRLEILVAHHKFCRLN